MQGARSGGRMQLGAWPGLSAVRHLRDRLVERGVNSPAPWPGGSWGASSGDAVRAASAASADMDVGGGCCILDYTNVGLHELRPHLPTRLLPAVYYLRCTEGFILLKNN